MVDARKTYYPENVGKEFRVLIGKGLIETSGRWKQPHLTKRGIFVKRLLEIQLASKTTNVQNR